MYLLFNFIISIDIGEAASVVHYMNEKLIGIVAVLLITIVLIICLLRIQSTEAFASKQDKAEAIYNWFKATNEPAYIDYKTHMGLRSNIVEYEDALGLRHAGRLTVDAIKAVL